MSAVIVTLPHGLAHGMQISVVSHEPIEQPAVLVRAASNQAWIPVVHLEGASVEFRP